MTVTFDYIPRQTKRGETIVNEKCSCGHLRTEHTHRFGLGHGGCTYSECDCIQFTWAGWKFAEPAKQKAG